LGKNVTVTVLDERFSSDPKVNNWLVVKDTDFYRRVVEVGGELIETVPRQGEGLDEFAERWEGELRDWRKKNPHGRVVATIGIGEDGHVAGISPFPEESERFVEFMFTDKWVKGYVGNLQPAERVTVTAKFMEEKIDVGIVYVVGERKRLALVKVLANEGRLAETPARILREMREVRVLTDLAD
jgi:6-phosphogluconolactonase/glucosamine-6-phosphate isomerase/deaminase